MKRNLLLIFIVLPCALGALYMLHAQPQIPTLQVCNPTKVSGKAALVKIVSRGTFLVNVALQCSTQYPSGTLEIKNIKMTDSIVQGTLIATSVEQVTSTGKVSPTVYLNGRCKAEKIQGCRFWMMMADNDQFKKGTSDIISFLVFDATGKRVAYGTGPVVEGNIEVAVSAE